MVTANPVPLFNADVYSYDEDDMVLNPKLPEHLSHFGIDMMTMQKVMSPTITHCGFSRQRCVCVCVCLRAHALMSVPNDSPLDISVWLSFQDRPLVLMYDTGVLIILYDTSAEEMVSQDGSEMRTPQINI